MTGYLRDINHICPYFIKILKIESKILTRPKKIFKLNFINNFLGFLNITNTCWLVITKKKYISMV